MLEKILLESGTIVYISSIGYYNYSYKEEQSFTLENKELVNKPQFSVRIAKQEGYIPLIANQELIKKYSLKSKIIWIKE